jgi:hypothetical protein
MVFIKKVIAINFLKNLKYIFKKLMAITFFIKTIKKLGDIKSPKINAIFHKTLLELLPKVLHAV